MSDHWRNDDRPFGRAGARARARAGARAGAGADGSLDHLVQDRRFAPSPAVRLWMPVIIAFVVQIPATVFVTLQRGFGAYGLLPILCAIIGVFALLGIRRWPGPTTVLVVAAAATTLLTSSQPGPPPISAAFAIILGIAYGAQLWVFITVGAAWIAVFLIGALTGLQWSPIQITATTFAVALCIVLGMASLNRAERLREFRASYAQRRQTAEQAERVRIARELHDVLAHSLSQINVQAGVGLHLMDQQPEQAREALQNIKHSSKDALEEVREVLGMLRSSASDQDSDSNRNTDSDTSEPSPLRPQEGIADLEPLAELRRSQGLNVVVIGATDADVLAAPAAVQFAAYRIAQEALTNVVRHSSATEARVQLQIDAGDLILEITDDGATGATPLIGGGLLGMRERAELLGGSFNAGWELARLSPDAQPGFTILARLPIRRNT